MDAPFVKCKICGDWVAKIDPHLFMKHGIKKKTPKKKVVHKKWVGPYKRFVNGKIQEIGGYYVVPQKRRSGGGLIDKV